MSISARFKTQLTKIAAHSLPKPSTSNASGEGCAYSQLRVLQTSGTTGSRLLPCYIRASGSDAGFCHGSHHPSFRGASLVFCIYMQKLTRSFLRPRNQHVISSPRSVHDSVHISESIPLTTPITVVQRTYGDQCIVRGHQIMAGLQQLRHVSHSAIIVVKIIRYQLTTAIHINCIKE